MFLFLNFFVESIKAILVNISQVKGKPQPSSVESCLMNLGVSIGKKL